MNSRDVINRVEKKILQRGNGIEIGERNIRDCHICMYQKLAIIGVVNYFQVVYFFFENLDC